MCKMTILYIALTTIAFSEIWGSCLITHPTIPTKAIMDVKAQTSSLILFYAAEKVPTKAPKYSEITH